MSLADLTLSEYLQQIAARTPAPGGGAAAASAGAIAAALVEMAASFAPGDRDSDSDSDSDSTVGERASALRGRLIELADDDLVAYQPVLHALRRDQDDPDRATALHDALSGAAEPPLAIAEAAAEVAELGAMIAPANRHLLGDATAAVQLATAATIAAVRLVEINLARFLDDPRPGQAAEYAGRALEARARLSVAL